MREFSVNDLIILGIFAAGFLVIWYIINNYGVTDNPLKKARRRFGLSLKDYFSRPEKKTHHRELMRALLSLNESALEELFILYKQEFGAGAARYARKTYGKWRAGEVSPISQTFERFLLHLPRVMNFDLKCEVLRRLIEEFAPQAHHELTVFTDDWEEPLTPLVQRMIDKAFTAKLPYEIERRLNWLAENEAQTAQEILKRSHAEESRIAVSHLREEISAIEKLLAATHLKPKVTHQLKFPFGTITLNFKKRS